MPGEWQEGNREEVVLPVREKLAVHRAWLREVWGQETAPSPPSSEPQHGRSIGAPLLPSSCCFAAPNPGIPVPGAAAVVVLGRSESREGKAQPN